MFKKTFYGAKISPACAYCAHGSPAPDQRMVLCRRRGAVSPYFPCSRSRWISSFRASTPARMAAEVSWDSS